MTIFQVLALTIGIATLCAILNILFDVLSRRKGDGVTICILGLPVIFLIEFIVLWKSLSLSEALFYPPFFLLVWG